MNGISLFTGSGIGELVFKQIIPGYRTVCYVEWDKFCQRLIQKRIADGVLDDAPIWDDVRTFDGRPWAGRVDFISAGFPCQPFSVAGKRERAGDRRNEWPATWRIIHQVRPRYVLLENVVGLLTDWYIRTIFGRLAEIGYDCEWDVVSAAFVGALHRRARLWILAYPNGQRREWGRHTSGKGKWCWSELEGLVQEEIRLSVPAGESGGISDGIPNRVDRLKCIGNAWCPQVVARILRVSNDQQGKAA